MPQSNISRRVFGKLHEQTRNMVVRQAPIALAPQPLRFICTSMTVMRWPQPTCSGANDFGHQLSTLGYLTYRYILAVSAWCLLSTVATAVIMSTSQWRRSKPGAELDIWLVQERRPSKCAIDDANPRFSIKWLIVAISVCACVFAVIRFAQGVLEVPDDAYAMWAAGDVLLDYMAANDTDWPESWTELGTYHANSGAGSTMVGPFAGLAWIPINASSSI